MSIKFGTIDKILPNITSDMFNNIGKHNSFTLVLNTDNRYPDKGDPIVLRFDANVNKWIYVADKRIIDFGHLIETVDVENDYLALSKIPLDGVLWDIFIYEEDVLVEVLRESDISLRNNIITGLRDYIGKTLSVRYSYGEHAEVIAPVRVDNKVETTYITDVDDFIDSPRSDINDINAPTYYEGEIGKSTKLPNVNEDIDLEMVGRELATMTNMINLMQNRKIITTERLLIYENKATLPVRAFGDIIHNMAIVFDGREKEFNVMLEVSCKTDGDFIFFDEEDELNGKYCMVSYFSFSK